VIHPGEQRRKGVKKNIRSSLSLIAFALCVKNKFVNYGNIK